MFSNLASYIFGSTVENGEPEVQATTEAEEAPTEQTAVVEKAASDEEEWVLVGEGVPSLTLGSLSDAMPRPSLGSTGSSDPSIDSEDSFDAPMLEGEHRDATAVTLTRTARRLTVPFSSISGPTSLSDVRCVRAAQSLKQKESGKHLSSKALERRNKAVKHHSCGSNVRKSTKAPTMSLKASGSSRHLKQC
jgi:hypothetical protein